MDDTPIRYHLPKAGDAGWDTPAAPWVRLSGAVTRTKPLNPKSK